MARIRYLFSKYILTPISRSIRNKLLLIMLVIAIIPLMIATIISYTNTKDAIETEVLGQNNAKIDWVQTNIKNDLSRINESLTAFYFDNDITFYLNKINSDGSLGSISSSFYANKIKSYLMANYQDFQLVSFYIVDSLKAYHYSMESALTVEQLPADFMQTNPLFQASSDLIFNEPVLNQYDFSVKTSGPVMVKYYRRFDDRRIIAVLVTQLKWKMFDNAIELLNLEKDSQIYFVRGNGQVIYGRYSTLNQDQLLSIMAQVKATGSGQIPLVDNNYIFMRQVYDDIYLIKTLPIAVIRQAYIKTLNYQLVLIILTVALIVVLTFLLGSWITRPITTLARSMHHVENYLENNNQIYQVQVKSNDEIKILEQSYQMMLERIKLLIEEEYKQKIEMQSAQLMALQSQINPHFMYNTLQMIGAIAVENNTPEIYKLIAAFSNMMRYNMQFKQDMVTIKQELENLDYYLDIQRERFDGNLKVEYEVDPSCLNCRIPKLTLQPVVENCFKYGFTKKIHTWQIRVLIASEDDTIMITVEDNGIGIPKEKLAEINRVLAESTRSIYSFTENLGLKNIDSRIKLFFGNDYGLTIRNREHSGTSVAMRIARKE